MISLSFVGCDEEKPGDKVDIGYISGTYQMIIDSVDKINCDYLLVYRSNASYSELDSFVDFLEKLSSSSSATFQICPDTLNVTDANQKIILLGNTLYNESTETANLMENIRSNNYYDYLLRGYHNTLSVCWMSKYGREDAFSYILSNLLNNEFEKKFNNDYSYMYLSDRSDTPVVTIDDINVIQYSVVMSGSPSYIERSAAQRLVRAIKEATGVEVPLVTDAVEESRYEILIGDTNRGQTYVTQFFATKRYAIAQYSSKLILRGGQIEATSEAVIKFAQMIENASITAEPVHIKPNFCETGSISTYGGDNFGGYELVFSDEFNSQEINTNKGLIEDGAIVGYGDAAGLMHFKPSQVKIDGNNLVVSTILGDTGYVSGHITTQKSFSMKYGYVEVRAKMRAVPGFWAKMVLINQNDSLKNISQIDVFNSIASNDTIFASAGILESDTYYTKYLDLLDPKYEAYRSGSFEYEKVLNDDEYHTYGVEWTPDYIRYFIDGVSYGTVEIGTEKFKELRETELYLDFTMGVNLTEQVAIDEVAMWPLDVCIDWVRVYQREGSTNTDRTVIVETTPEVDKNTDKKPATKR
jgi:hypothetical protein